MRLVVLILAALATACGNSSDSPMAPDPITGMWGGDRVRLTLAANGGQLDFDCAHGTLTSALTTRDDGTFTVPGFYQVEGGPARDPIERQPTTFSGRITGNTMTISFTVNSQPLGPYTLTRDREAILRRCL
jgi:hypothetical protein